MDAVRNLGTMQFQYRWILRDLNKVYCAIMNRNSLSSVFSTGNWGKIKKI